jgi:hypothetical protein
MEGGWWNADAVENTKALVARMAGAVSGRQRDPCGSLGPHGGRLKRQTSAPSKLGQLHELLNFFAPSLLKHLVAKVTYFPAAERILSRGDQCLDYLSESNQLGTDDDTRDTWIAQDPRYQGTLHPDYFTCRYQGNLIYKARDGTAYCKNCWNQFDEDYPVKKSLTERIRPRRTMKEVSKVQALLDECLGELKTKEGQQLHTKKR